MATTKDQFGTSSSGARMKMPEDSDNDHDRDQNNGAERAPVPRRADGQTPFTVYKPGQAAYLRWFTAGGAGAIVIAGSYWIWEQLVLLPWGWADITYVRSGIPVVLVAAAAYFVFRMIGQHRGVVDFLIATEGEMKKVNWSSRKEIMGATRVVIVTVFSLAIVLFIVDLCFIFIFSKLGVLQIDVSGIFGRFGGGGG